MEIHYIIYIIVAVLWSCYTIYYGINAWNHPSRTNPFFLQAIPGIFVTYGVLGTFLGTTMALYKFDVGNIEGSIGPLLDGMKTAFISSLFGIFFSIIYSWVVKYLLHTKGSEFKMPESKESIYLQEVRDEIRSAKFNELAKVLSEANSTALYEAMTGLLKDFNKTFQSLIEGLVNENFKELKVSIDKLVEWQVDHRTAVDQLFVSIKSYLGTFEDFNKRTLGLVERLESNLPTIDASLSSITQNTETLVGADGELSTIVKELQRIMVKENQLTKSFDKATTSINALEQGARSFSETQQQITNWLNREAGLQAAMTTFNSGMEKLSATLEQLDRINTTDLQLLEDDFRKRIGTALNTTFANFDRIFSEYIQHIHNNEGKEIIVRIKKESNGLA